jgi:WD40 repeat protein
MTLAQRIADATQSAQAMVAELDTPAIERRRPVRYRVAVGLAAGTTILLASLGIGAIVAGREPPVVTQPAGPPGNGAIVFDPSDGSCAPGSDPCPDLIAIMPDGSPAGGFHLDEVEEVTSFSWAPDGRQLAIVNQDGTSIFDTETGAIKHLYDCRTCNVSWAPDGSAIAVGSTGGLRILDSRTGTERIKLPAAPGGMAWSPDGEWIAYTSMRTGELFKIGVDGSSGPQRVATNPDGDEQLSAIWTPDGDQILFLAMHHSDQMDENYHRIALMSVDSAGSDNVPSEVVELDSCLCMAEWATPGMTLAPDGSQLLIFTISGGTRLTRLDGSVIRSLEGGNAAMAWQPLP